MTIAAEIRKQIKAKVALSAVGNTKRKLKDVAADLINAANLPYAEVAGRCYLCTSTIKNLATGKTKNPQAETIERVFRYFEYSVTFDQVKLKGQFENQPKVKMKK